MTDALGPLASTLYPETPDGRALESSSQVDRSPIHALTSKVRDR